MMSCFENYNQTSRNFDKTRVPIGVGVLVQYLTQSARPISQMRLLDAGCGTGSYSYALINRVRRINAVDASKGMIEMAFRKLEHFQQEGRITLNQAKIDALPFTSNTFDAAMINQVLHHIESNWFLDFPTHRCVFQEIYRVLRPQGILVINTCSQEQLLHSYWYYHLIPKALHTFRRRYLPIDELGRMLGECGFSVKDSIAPLTDVFQGEAYFDPMGPLREEWRDGDSIFAMASAHELESAVTRIRQVEAEGMSASYLKDHDKQRASLGQVTFIIASKD